MFFLIEQMKFCRFVAFVTQKNLFIVSQLSLPQRLCMGGGSRCVWLLWQHCLKHHTFPESLILRLLILYGDVCFLFYFVLPDHLLFQVPTSFPHMFSLLWMSVWPNRLHLCPIIPASPVYFVCAPSSLFQFAFVLLCQAFQQISET